MQSNLIRANRIGSTKEQALYEAKGLLQRYGFNGFSFQHIADLLGIKKPSLYDHFKSKDELGQRLVRDYFESFKDWSNTIESFGPKEKIEAFFDIFHRFACQSSKICPMAALIGDYNSLSKPIKKDLNHLYKVQLDWIREVIREGQKKKIFKRDQLDKDLANLVVSVAIGSQFSARILEDPSYIKGIKAQAIAILES